MKPTVINNSSETSHPVHHEQSQQHPNPDNGSNNGQNPANNDHSRRFPQFRQHGFGFNDPDDDVFANMGLRSRLNRMGRDPFDWSARKRQNANDPYDHYFRDDVDFPHFGSTWDAFNRIGNKRSQHPSEANDRSGFFDYLPPEFRQYMPEHFEGRFNSGRPQQQPQQPTSPQQQHHQSQQQSPNTQQSNSKSNLCDAAIQTDDSLGNAGNNDANRPNANQSSANQPNNGYNRSAASSSSASTPYGNKVHMSTSADGPGAYASASAGNNQNQYYQQSPHYGQEPYGRNYQQQHPYAQQQQQPPPPPPQQQHYPQQQPAAAAAASPQPQQNVQSNQGVRTVPIFIEGTNVPVNRSNENVPQQVNATANKPRPEPLNKESFLPNEPIPAPAPPPPSQPDQHSDQQGSGDADGPPQTPHTADCISKIQAIQRDVLDLMCAVEQFGGKRGDKDYMYLDEMLTRNLLKLDTIDTNGKESIRLARREAIKCVQASIAVLEAKSDLHLNEKKDGADTSNDGTSSAEPNNQAKDEKSDKMDVDETNATAADATTNEIPEVQQNVENITIDDKANETDKTDTNSQTKSETETKSENTENPKQ